MASPRRALGADGRWSNVDSRVAMKLHTYAGNVHALQSLIVARYNGVEIELPPFEMGKDNKTKAFLAKSPMGKVPVLETPEGCICEAGAIARYVARIRAEIESRDKENSSRRRWSETKIARATDLVSMSAIMMVPETCLSTTTSRATRSRKNSAERKMCFVFLKATGS